MKIFEELNIIEIVDKRFYEKDGEYFPSVTTILDCYPKGYAFNEWLKSIGHNADIVANIAAEKGSFVHNAIASLIAGNEINFKDEVRGDEYKYHGNKIGLDEWKAILKFQDFYDNFVEKSLESERKIFCKSKKYAGTCDYICKLKDGRVALIDFKYSNAIQISYFMQLSAYCEALKEEGIKIDVCGVLWLKALTRGRDKTEKTIQGEGWQLKIPEKSIEYYFKLFEHTHAIYLEEHENEKPKTYTLTNFIKLQNK